MPSHEKVSLPRGFFALGRVKLSSKADQDVIAYVSKSCKSNFFATGDRRRVWLAMLQFDGNFNRDFRGYS
jgi:hypothetical protein